MWLGRPTAWWLETALAGRVAWLAASVAAGAGIAESRWTRQRKKEILESRTVATTLLAETIAGLDFEFMLAPDTEAPTFAGLAAIEAVRRRSPWCRHAGGCCCCADGST